MKEYKYKINGNVYNVAIGDIEENIAHVEVNGTHYKVEMENAPKPKATVIKPVVGGRRGKERADHHYPRSHEDGKQHQCRPGWQGYRYQCQQRRLYP